MHEQTLAVYRLLDELKAAHPGLEIESCSSGGARVDLGVLERTDRVWVSDCIDPLERQEMHRWTTQLIPPELLGSHIASGRSHTTGRRHDLDFRAATAIFGHLGIEWNIALASAEELDELAAWIRCSRSIAVCCSAATWSGWTSRRDPDRRRRGRRRPAHRALLLVATGRSEVVSLGRIRLPGLAADQRYRVTPLMLDYPPSGLRPPPWWGVQPLERARPGRRLGPKRMGQRRVAIAERLWAGRACGRPDESRLLVDSVARPRLMRAELVEARRRP